MLGANIVTFAASIVLGLRFMGLGNNFGYDCLQYAKLIRVVDTSSKLKCVAAVPPFFYGSRNSDFD